MIDMAEKRKLIEKSVKILELRLPSNLEMARPFIGAIASLLKSLVELSGIDRTLFGFLLRDIVICIRKGWVVPAAMMLGIANRLLEPNLILLRQFSKSGKYKVEGATRGLILSIKDEIEDGIKPTDWKVCYLWWLVRCLAPHGERQVPGMKGEVLEQPKARHWDE